MPKELDIQQGNLVYTARFARPVFHLWGKGGQIVQPLYEALSPYGVTVGNIVLHANVANSAEPVLTIWVRGNSTVKFAFDRIEFVINGPTQEFFEMLPRLFAASTGWIKNEVPKFKFASHSFGYGCHASVKNSTVKEILDSLHPKTLKTAGVSLGSGSIFYNSVTDKNWKTRLWFDQSQAFPGALFISLLIESTTEEMDYEAMMIDGRDYFRSILAEVNLTLPELSQ